MKLIVYALVLVTTTALCSMGVAQEKANTPSGPGQQASVSQANSETNPDAQFMQILGKLASLRLERLKRINATVPGSVAPDDVALLELQLKAIDKLRQETQASGQVNGYSMLLELAEISKAAAVLEWNRVSAIRDRSPSSISEGDAEMTRLRAELADVNLLRGRSLATRSVQEQQNWALQFLFVELQGLHDAVRNLEGRQ
jgi:hypothetical protein